MIKRILLSILNLSVISILIGFLHYLLVKKIQLFIPLQNIYFFNYSLSLVVLLILYYIHNKFNDKVGYAFLALGILKMMVSIYFLMPLIESDFSNKIPDTLNFFFCYFMFLIIESIILVKLLNKKQ